MPLLPLKHDEGGHPRGRDHLSLTKSARMKGGPVCAGRRPLPSSSTSWPGPPGFYRLPLKRSARRASSHHSGCRKNSSGHGVSDRSMAARRSTGFSLRSCDPIDCCRSPNQTLKARRVMSPFAAQGMGRPRRTGQKLKPASILPASRVVPTGYLRDHE